MNIQNNLMKNIFRVDTFAILSIFGNDFRNE